jgi:hypothetical protein
LLDPLARGALPRLRAFRRRRRGRTGAWVGSGERQIDVWFPPPHTPTPEHRDPANSMRRRMVGFHARGARHRSDVRAQEHGTQAQRWGAPGQAATVHASTCRKKDGSARRPARKHARLGAQRTTPRCGITRHASAAGCRSEVYLGAGVRTSTTCPLTLVCYTRTPQHKIRSTGTQGMTRRAAHDTAARCEVALGSTITGTARQFMYKRARHSGMGLLRARLEQEWHSSVAVHGVTTTNRRTTARRCAHRHGMKGERCERRGRQQRSRRGEGVVVAGLT